MNCFETYAPVVTWFAIRLMIIIGIIFGWYLHQVDFVMVYPQAPIKMDIYMELTQGIMTVHGNSKDRVSIAEMIKLSSGVWCPCVRSSYGSKSATNHYGNTVL